VDDQALREDVFVIMQGQVKWQALVDCVAMSSRCLWQSGMSVVGATVRMRLGSWARQYSVSGRERPSYDQGVKIKMSVALASDLRGEAREAARRSGKTMSEWIAETIEARLLAEKNDAAAHERRMRGLGEYLDAFEAEHGAFTDEQLARAADELGLPWPLNGSRE
jgi:hypothetical protein